MGDADKDQYLLDRGEVETKRLNEQHVFAVIMGRGHLVHPSIPLDTLSSVADICTGTGIWLKDIDSKLSKTTPHRLDGFDISDIAFPKNDLGKRRFYLHNVLQPFPEEFHGQYDLVHMRYLSWAFKTDEYVKVVANVAQLLKPGGYFAWNDADNRLVTHLPEQDEFLQELITTMTGIPYAKGMTQEPSPIIQDAFKTIGLEDVKIEIPDHVPPPEAREMARAWGRDGWRMLGPIALKLEGKAKTDEEAKQQAEEKSRIYEDYFSRGYFPTFEHRMLVGRKPE